MSNPDDPLEAVEQALDRLTAELAADGYESGYPTWELGLRMPQMVEIDSASHIDCPKCGTHEREHAAFCAPTGRTYGGIRDLSYVRMD
jgi:hypothetical protein